MTFENQTNFHQLTTGALKRYQLPSLSTSISYESLTPVRHETRYDTEHNNTTFFKKLRHDTVEIQLLIN